MLRTALLALVALTYVVAPAHAADRESAFAADFIRLCVKGEATLAQTAAAEKWSAMGPEGFPRHQSWLGMKPTVFKFWMLPNGTRLQSVHAASADGARTGGTCALAGFGMDTKKVRAALLADGAVTDATPPDMAGAMNVFAAPNGSINLSSGKATGKFLGQGTVQTLTLTLPR
jgi:hypothetical protein